MGRVADIRTSPDVNHKIELGVPHFSRSVREVGRTFHEVEKFIRHIFSIPLTPKIRHVPSRLKRFYGSGDLHFITSSCYHRRGGWPTFPHSGMPN